MRIRWHHYIPVTLRQSDECTAQRLQLRIDLLISLIQPKQEIRRHLIIPAPPGMQFLPRLADPLDQGRLDHHVNVFQALIKFEIVRFDIALDGF